MNLNKSIRRIFLYLLLMFVFCIATKNLNSLELGIYLGIKIVDSESGYLIKEAHAEAIRNCYFKNYGDCNDVYSNENGMVYLFIGWEYDSYDQHNPQSFEISHPKYKYQEISFKWDEIIYLEKRNKLYDMIVTKPYRYERSWEREEIGTGEYMYVEVKIFMKPIPYRFDD